MTAVGPPSATLPRWLPWVFVPVLALPMHPFWLDFEQVRRGLLMVLVGAWLLWRPVLAAPAAHDRWLCAFLGVAVVGTVASAGTVNWWEAAYEAAWFAVLGLLLRLPDAGDRLAWQLPAAATVIAVSLFGLLQRLGWGELSGYGTPHEPVSTLGNLNVAAEFVAVGLVAAAVAVRQRPVPALLAVACGTAYLAVNGSRGPSLLAMPAALAWLLLAQRGRPRLALLLACSLAVGWLTGRTVAALGPSAPPTATAPPGASPGPGTSTIQVRLEIARSCLGMAADAPVLGHGLGQFPVQYPRYRSQREIELSTFDRTFAALPRTAHDDWLELLVETGPVALALLLVGLLLLARVSWSERIHLAPLVALAVAMLVRAPLGNAPAAAVALLCAVPAPPRASRARPWTGRLLGLCLLALGALPIAANTRFASYQAFRRTAGAQAEPPPAALAGLVAAADWAPFEPRYRQELAHVLLNEGNPAGAQKVAAQAAALHPHDPTLLLLLAEASARRNDLVAAEQIGLQALRIDPGNPEVRVLLSTVWQQAGRHDDAVRVVCEHLHARLRAGLQAHFLALRDVATARGDTQGALRCAAEAAFVAAVDQLGGQTKAALTRGSEQIKAMAQAFGAAGRQRSDVRWRLVMALHALDLDDRTLADELGRGIAEDVAFPAWQRVLLDERLPRLDACMTWHAWLQRHGQDP